MFGRASIIAAMRLEVRVAHLLGAAAIELIPQRLDGNRARHLGGRAIGLFDEIVGAKTEEDYLAGVRAAGEWVVPTGPAVDVYAAWCGCSRRTAGADSGRDIEATRPPPAA